MKVYRLYAMHVKAGMWVLETNGFVAFVGLTLLWLHKHQVCWGAF